MSEEVELAVQKEDESLTSSEGKGHDETDEYWAPTKLDDSEKGYGSGKLGLTEFKFGPFIFNPIVTVLSAVTLWTFTIWCMADGEGSNTELKLWKSWVTETFSWLYIGTQNIWIIFMIVVLYKYGDKKLGKDDEKPEFSDVSYLAMLFTAGVAIGLVVYGTAEPLYHYDYWLQHRFNSGFENNNDKANFALLMTLFHWGLHGWVPYALVGVQIGIMSFRHGLPLLMRSAFFPILGRHTWGWIGDLIDTFTVVTVVSGVCTSLGLGVWQLAVGLKGVEIIADCDPDCMKGWYIGIIWGITILATLSLVAGLGKGIKTIAHVSVFSALFIFMVCVLGGQTWFYLNAIVQISGYYIQYSMGQLGWHVDAFAQLPPGSGGDPEQRGASSNFMDSWTIFYWGWWIAWCPFVGMFIARISRGRTVRQVIIYSLVAPLLCSLLWFVAFGSMAISMENNAQILWQAGTDLYNDPTTFQAGQMGSPSPNFKAAYADSPIDHRDPSQFGTGPRCNAWTQDEFDTRPLCSETKFESNNPDYCIPASAQVNAAKGCGACFHMVSTFAKDGMTGCEIFEANNPGAPCPAYISNWQPDSQLTPVCLFTDWDQESSWFMTVSQFGDTIGGLLVYLSIISLILFFVTSSDSGSLVVDTIAANGRDECSLIQRIFWAFTEGGLATGLVAGADAGKEKSVLQGLQAASICTGLPYTILLCFIMPAIWYGFEMDTRKERGYKTFKTPVYGGIFDVIQAAISLGKAPFKKSDAIAYVMYLAAPFFGVFQLSQATKIEVGGSQAVARIVLPFLTLALFITSIVMILYGLAEEDEAATAFGLVLWCCDATILTGLRYEVRTEKGINGNMVEDFFCAACPVTYPNVIIQCLEARKE